MKYIYTLLLSLSFSFLQAQAFDFYSTIYYLSPDAGTANGTELTLSGNSLSSFNYNTAPLDHPLYTTGVYFPVEDCSGQNLWVRVQHIAADPNGTTNGHNVPNTINGPFEAGILEAIGGMYGFLYEFQIFRDEELSGTRTNTLAGLFPTAITVASLETLYNDGGFLYEWLSFEIKNEGSSGWYLNSTNFTGINPNSTPGFSSELNYATTGTPTQAPTGFSTDFPYGSQNIYAVDMNLSNAFHSEFKMSTTGVSKFTYGYEFTSGGYQGMSMAFGIPPIANVLMTPPLCNGDFNATISLEVTGNEPISYDWGGGQVSSTIENLSSGTYTVTISDANGCTVQQDIVITDPAMIFTDLVTVDNMDGTFTFFPNISGGLPPYTYLWNTGDTSVNITVSEPGDYPIDIIDSNGCVTTLSFAVVSVEGKKPLSNRIMCSPNPTNGRILFSMGDQAQQGKLLILDQFGKTLEQVTISSFTKNVALDLSGYASGLYFYKFISTTSEQTGKILLEK